MRHIYLIRHGQASFDADDYDQLSTLGEKQSRLLGDWLKQSGQTVDQIIIGGNLRHRQTAQQCLQQFRSDPHQLPEQDWILDRGFDEFDHQEVILKHCSEFSDFRALKQFVSNQSHPRRTFQLMFSDAMSRWTSGDYDDYSESWVQFQTRCRDAFMRLTETKVDEKSHQHYWVFTSGGTISTLIQAVLGIPDQGIFDLNASLINTGVSKLFIGRTQTSLSYLNSPSHLELHQRPELITYR
nr:histidine phosphatase family protein [uncultured Undibacterium sp.]